MALTTNQPLLDRGTPLSAIEQFIADNPDKYQQLENGQGSESPATYYNNSRDKPPKPKAKPKPKPIPTPEKVRKVSTHPETVAYNHDLQLLRDTLASNKMMTVEMFNGRKKATIFPMIALLRNEGIEILTISTVNTAIGWVLKSALINALETQK